jgi:hypothetical protein
MHRTPQSTPVETWHPLKRTSVTLAFSHRQYITLSVPALIIYQASNSIHSLPYFGEFGAGIDNLKALPFDVFLRNTARKRRHHSPVAALRLSITQSGFQQIRLDASISEGWQRTGPAKYRDIFHEKDRAATDRPMFIEGRKESAICLLKTDLKNLHK